jgi:hypothetical protein
LGASSGAGVTTRPEVTSISPGPKRLVVATLVGIMILINGAMVLHAITSRSAKGFSDYQAFYAAGRLIASGQRTHLYDLNTQTALHDQLFGGMNPQPAVLPFYHLAFEGLIFLPLQALGYAASFWTWTVLNLLMLVAIAVLLSREICIMRWYEILALELAFFPIAFNLMAGQMSVVLLLIYTVAYRELKEGNDVRAGAVLALALFKFHLVLPFVLALALKRYWKFVAGFLAGAVPVALVSLWITGVDGAMQYPQLLASVQRNPAARQVFFDSMANLRGLLWAMVGANPAAAPRTLALALLGFLSLLMLFLLSQAKVEQDRAGLNFDRYFSLALVFTLLVSYHSNPHDLSILFLGLMLMLSRAVSMRKNLLPVVLAVVIFSFSPICILAFVNGAFFLFALPLIGWALLLAAWTMHKPARNYEEASA